MLSRQAVQLDDGQELAPEDLRCAFKISEQWPSLARVQFATLDAHNQAKSQALRDLWGVSDAGMLKSGR